MPFQELATSKYWNESVKTEIKELRREQNRQFTKNISMFFFVIGVMVATLFALQTMPQWLPVVIEFLDAQGWMPVLEGNLPN